jgi:hypothetical protein
MKGFRSNPRILAFWGAIACMAMAPALAWSQGKGLDVKIVGSVAGVSCMECHGSTPAYPILGARLGYDESAHKKNGNSRYANGGGCQKCHTNEGFVDFVAKGTVDSKAFVRYPSQPGCVTCHTYHETGTMELRSPAAVALVNGSPFAGGKGTMCAACHQARAVPAATAVPTAANKISASWGSHHGPQADILAGSNAFEYVGKNYTSSVHAFVVSDTCVSCHMSQPEARYGFSPEVGGHSFNIVGAVHENDLANVSGCVSCHKDIKQVAGSTYFNILADADYDIDGAKEPVVQGLLDRLSNKSGTGLLQGLPIPFYDKAGNWSTPKADTLRPVSEMAALYNYKMILEDRSLGIHNAKYTIQILYDVIQSIDAKFDVSRRPK